MSKIIDVADRVLDVEVLTIGKVIEIYGGVVTINGMRFGDYKGERVPQFSIYGSGGKWFWGGCKKLRELADEYEKAYDGDLNAINEDFSHTGVTVNIGTVTKTKADRDFRPVTKIGYVDFDKLADDAEVTDDEPAFVDDDEDTETVNEAADDDFPPF